MAPGLRSLVHRRQPAGAAARQCRGLLDDVNESNGPLRFIPGSHIAGVSRADSARERRSGQHLDPDDIALSPETLRALDERYGSITATGGAGTAVFFHPEIVHGSSPNLSSRRAGSPSPPTTTCSTHHGWRAIRAGVLGEQGHPATLPRARPAHREHGVRDRARVAVPNTAQKGATVTTTARAVVLQDFTTRPSLAAFEVPRRSPRGLTVACRYGGICGTDLHLTHGHLNVPTPLVLGHEGLGTVHELGRGTVRDSDGNRLES
ncbi:alcohol dehydrogenase catalytic domain-containing protein [Streptacidiphilus sp. 4-A2]|nr:alcohol dehydrogenase catalytic domain-containing protein [Streptacidiphilus sp. 4-A2]